MTDLEITKLCGDAMDLLREVVQVGKVHPVRLGSSTAPVDHYKLFDGTLYDPLHDDAQAMALVKKFELCISSEQDRNGKRWEAGDGDGRVVGESKDLNRAICLCVANMQQAKA